MDWYFKAVLRGGKCHSGTVWASRATLADSGLGPVAGLPVGLPAFLT